MTEFVKTGFRIINPLSANFTKRSNTLKQFLGKLLTNCLSVFGHFGGLALKGFKAPTKIVFMKDKPFTGIIIFTLPLRYFIYSF